jgi:hypothetical protein
MTPGPLKEAEGSLRKLKTTWMIVRNLKQLGARRPLA